MRRRLLTVLLVVPGVAVAGVGAIRLAVAWTARARVFDVESAPVRSVGIVFGAAIGSQMLRDRVATAAALYRAHKVRHLLLSGDNRLRSYDEPRAMKRMALASGVPESALVLDYAGRRTYDSCARARAIFQLDDAILVTQDFHLSRALYLCAHLGLPGAVGVSADRRVYGSARWLWLRELLASVRAFIDVHVRPPPVVGGPALPIQGPGPADDARDAEPPADDPVDPPTG